MEEFLDESPISMTIAYNLTKLLYINQKNLWITSNWQTTAYIAMFLESKSLWNWQDVVDPTLIYHLYTDK